MEIQIHHIGSQGRSPMFEVIRSMDMKRTEAVSLPEPAAFPVKGHPQKHFLSALRWYLEEYLQTPFGVFPQLAECVVETMQAWGAAAFDALFTGYARDWYQEAKRQSFNDFHIKITSDSPEVMSWPWEALYSKDDGYLALRCCIDRQLSNIGDPPPLPAALSQDVIHILYIIPRPYGENDVGYHILANSLVDFISKNNLPVTLDVLRPPTFDQLRKVLYDRPGYYHIVHFDGHGGYGTVPLGSSSNLYGASEGLLVFETDDGGPDPVETERLAQLLAEYNIPFMVMNACQSGMIDGQAQDPFASVAAGMLKAGVRSVVAMGYSLYVSGAKEFIPAFYERLFSTGKVSEAMRAGRGRMLQQMQRDCVIGKLPLRDWVVPVLYQQLPAESAVLPKMQPGENTGDDGLALPEGAKMDNDYGFIGRGSDVQKLERVIQRQRQAGILIHGQAGIGKTTLAKGFLRWQKNTGAVWEHVFWFDFQEIHSVEYIIDQLIGELIGTAFMAKPMEEKLYALVRQLSDKPYLLIWDNFESASGIEGTEILPQLSSEDHDRLAQLLKELRGGKTKVLITSRSEETWLQVQSCYRLALGGLTGEDLWEYCNAVVNDLALTLDRNNQTYAKILDKLCGNPLAIRSILLRLQDRSAEQLLAELDSGFEGMEGDESTRRLQAAYAVFGSDLIERYLPILQLIGLHEYYAEESCLEAMLHEAGYSVEADRIHSCYQILEKAGFCTHIGRGVYRLHPALRGYLMRQTPAPAPVQKSFVDLMGSFADWLAGKSLYEVKTAYQMNVANFYYARQLAETHEMNTDYMALTQSLAYYAQEMRRFVEANELYAVLAKKGISSKHWDAAAGAFHQMGILAQEQRDFEAAETWYKKALAVKEKQGNERGMASVYHQLGILAQKQRNFEAAEAWYQKALVVEEKQEDKRGMAGTYHQLGILAQEQRNFEAAEAWYKESLAIEEKQGNEHGAASTYHQLGRIAQERRDFVTAEAWYKKSLVIKEKQTNEHGAAITYHQLGIIEQKQKNFAAAEAWYKKSLVIEEKQENEHGAAITYYQLGTLAEEQQDSFQAADFYLKSLKIFSNKNDLYSLQVVIRSYVRLLHNSADAERSQLLKLLSASMSQEAAEALEQMVAALKDADSNSSMHDKKNMVWALAQQNPDFPSFYAQYQEQISLRAALPAEFLDAVITAVKKDPDLSPAVKQYQENAQAARTFSIPGLPEAGIVIAALFLLSTHIKISRTKDGKWEFLLEHKASTDNTLEKIVQMLSDLFQK